jgi:hypothetical protein
MGAAEMLSGGKGERISYLFWPRQEIPLSRQFICFGYSSCISTSWEEPSS